MKTTKDALLAKIVGDVVSGTVGAGSTTTVIQLGVGEAAAFNRGAEVGLTGAGATLANDAEIRTVTLVNTSLDRLTVAPALPIAPASGNVVKLGCRHWLYYLSATQPGIYYERWPKEVPLDAIATAAAERRCIVSYGEVGRARQVFDRLEQPWEFRVYGRSVSFLSALESRIRQLLDHRPSALTLDGFDCELVQLGQSRMAERADMLMERVLPLKLATSLVYA